MKNNVFKIFMIGLIGLFAMDAAGIPIVHYSRVKKNCGLLGCSSTNYVKNMVTLIDGSDAWSIDISCYGTGLSHCPRVLGPSEDPEDYDNYPEMEYIYGYIEDEVSNGNTSDSTSLNVADQSGTVWVYQVSWDVTPGAPNESDTEDYTIIRIGSL